MRFQDKTIGRLILAGVIIQVFCFISVPRCLAEEDAPKFPEDMRLASLNITDSVALPGFKEMQPLRLEKHTEEDTRILPAKARRPGLDVTASVVLPHFREIPPLRLENPPEPGVERTGGKKIRQTMVHVVGSHLGFITRPVSTVTKLASALFFIGQDAVRNIFLQHEDPVVASTPDTGQEMDLSQWEKDLDRITGTKLSSGRIRLLIDGEEFFPRLTTSFLEAKKAIHIRIYIYDNDDYAMRIAELLKGKSEDIDVRILVDGIGTITANHVHPDSMPKDHFPPKSIRDYFHRDSKVRMRFQKNLWLNLDHTKTILVDRKTVFIGGMNIGREYRYDWHDLMMEVEGPVVNTLQDDFYAAWAYAGFLGDFGYALRRRGANDAEAHDSDYPIRVLYTRTGESQIYRAQMAAIKRSRKYIYIQNPYFSDDAMLQELVKARKRGVDVRVVLPRKGNWKVMNRSNKLAANRMLANGIKVYLYPHMSHVKAAIFDGWACVGSANLDKASLRNNQEINLATSNPETVQALKERLFYPDFELSTLMTETNPVRFAHILSEKLADYVY